MGHQQGPHTSLRGFVVSTLLPTRNQDSMKTQPNAERLKLRPRMFTTTAHLKSGTVSWITVKRLHLKKPNIFYWVKITGVNYEHTCQLSTLFHRESKQKKGTLQPDLNGLNDISIGLLREKPNFKPDILQPLLLKYIPYYKSIDAKFIHNFRQRALHWIIHQSSRDFLMEDARNLSSQNPLELSCLSSGN
jgi:hypothetical protein